MPPCPARPAALLCSAAHSCLRGPAAACCAAVCAAPRCSSMQATLKSFFSTTNAGAARQSPQATGASGSIVHRSSATPQRVAANEHAQKTSAKLVQMYSPRAQQRRKRSQKKHVNLNEEDMGEDIDLTDNEQEESDQENEDDRAFLDDSEMYCEDGMEQAMCNNNSEDEEEVDAVQALHQAIASFRKSGARPKSVPKKKNGKRKAADEASGKRKQAKFHNEGDDSEHEHEGKKEPKSRQIRQLLVSYERGIGDTSRSVAEYHLQKPFYLPIADVITPWHLQPGRNKVDFGIDIGKLGRGAFGNEYHRRWVNDAQVQASFAKNFYVPINEKIPLRHISSDVPNTFVKADQCRSNSTSKVLHAFRAMHKQTELDLMDDRFYEKTIIGQQRTSKDIRRAIDSGPFGGLQGKPVDVLWRVYHGEEVTNISESTLQLVQALAMAIQGSRGDQLACMVRTETCDYYERAKSGMTKVQCGVHTLREYNFHEAGMHSARSAVDDIDPRISEKVWKYRYPDVEVPLKNNEELCKIVHSRFRTGNPELSATPINVQAQMATIDPVIVDLWIYKDIFAAWDNNTQEKTNVTVEAIYILPKCAACDPLIILKSIAENSPSNSTNILSCFSHMLQVIGLQKCSWDELFSTDRAGATYVVSEARMLEGIFKYCDTNHLRNVNVGGFRMDVQDSDEMREWNTYIETITSSRRSHYELMTRETIHDRKSQKVAMLPVQQFPVDIVHGLINWKVTVAQVRQEIDEYVQSYEDASERNLIKEELNNWFASHHFEFENGVCEPSYMYIPEGVGFALNTGLFIKVRTDNHKSHDDEKMEQLKKGKNMEQQHLLFPQPQQLNNMIRLWCCNMSETKDPLDEIFNQQHVILDYKWMQEEMQKLETIGEGVIMLREMIGEEMLATTKFDMKCNMRLREILVLTGKEKNSVVNRLDNLEDNTHLKYLFRAKMNLISTSIKKTLQIMRASEMLQWRIAAMGVNDLLKQDKTCKDKWIKDYAHMRAAILNDDMESWHNFLTPAAWLTTFYTTSNVRIDSDLSYMNTMLQRLLLLCFMAHNMSTPGAYGMTLRVGDCACSVNVLKESEGQKTTSIWLYDPKHPGMGIDQCTGNLGQQCNAAMLHISLTKEHRDLATLCVDTSLRNVSKMSYATLQGSGVMLNANGEIVDDQVDFSRKCGKTCFFTEYGKQSDDHLMMGWMESLMANSGDQELGAESGVLQEAWQTTMNGNSRSVFSIRKMPILLLTGNRPAPATPASAVEGARWMNIPSSTMDSGNGFYIIAQEDVKTHVAPSIPGFFNNEESTGEQARLANSMCRGDIRKDIKVIKREVVLRNRLHFLLMQWLKTDAVLLCSALTCDPKPYSYTLMSNFGNLECAVAQVTAGLRRAYLNKDARFWHRNAAGPWARVMQSSMHVYMSMSTSLLWSMDRTCLGWPVSLHLAYETGIKAALTQCIPFMALITSLHIWLSSAVLDISVMIMACYVYHFTGFQNFCPLRVLSLAMLGKLQSPEHSFANHSNNADWEAYMAFCNHIAPCVLIERMNTARNAADIGPRNVKKGILSAPSYETLQTWTSWIMKKNGVSAQNDIIASYVSRTQGPDQEKISVYCKPRLQFKFSESIKGFGHNKDNQHYTSDENISGTAMRALATMFAREQKPCAHTQRCKTQAVAAHENTVEFWNNVQTGTALPKASTSTNDVFKIKFEFVPYTGIWWEETMQNAGICDGILKLFLLQSQLNPNITHYEFFTLLMKPYLEYKRSSEQVYGGPNMHGKHQNAWNTPVLEKLNVFAFASAPAVDPQGEISGIDINFCMRLTHYVLFQGLGLTQDWNTAAHENSSFVSCVHLRNMSNLSLGCISLLLHTCCDKTMIPANGGHIRMPVPSPLFDNQHNEAKIVYDSKLHIDTHHHKMQGKSDNVLSISARIATPKNWALLDFCAEESALWYTHVLSDIQRMNQATSRATLFPFPPEAVAHCAFMFDDFLLANRRHMEQLEKETSNHEYKMDVLNNLFAEAMLTMGESVRMQDFYHKQPSLTDCCIRDQRELLCVTCKYGFLFTITFDNGQMQLKPCSRTHEWQAVCQNKDYKPFSPLPLENEQEEGVTLPSLDFCHLFRHGLCESKAADNSNVVVVDINYNPNCKRLPFYMFPVVHYPVLLELEHSGWHHKKGMLLHSLNYFQAKHYRLYYVRDCADVWFKQHNAEISTLYAECQLAIPDLCLHACFVTSNATTVHCFWAEHDGQIAHFQSADRIRDCLKNKNFMDFKMFMPCTATGSYLMLHHAEFGLAHVSFQDTDHAGDQLSERNLVADFYYLGCNNAMIHKQELFSTTFHDFKPRLLPAGEESKQWDHSLDYVWGLVVENEKGVFLQDGSYTISSLVSNPVQIQEPVLIQMDFINMSRCMLIEGSQIWITINAETYKNIQGQALEQGYTIMLPVSKELHNNMQGLRYLRGFYVLGGSLHDTVIGNNYVRVICVIAKQANNRRNETDDNADMHSVVNQPLDIKNTRFVAFSLPVLEVNGACIITRDRNDDAPFYKYLKLSK